MGNIHNDIDVISPICYVTYSINEKPINVKNKSQI